jgi:hypothetical protein
MKKVLVLLFVLALMVPTLVTGQDAGNTDNRIFGIHIGFVGGYDLLNDDSIVARDFGLNFTLSESIQLGFRSIGDLRAVAPAFSATLLDFGYYLTPNICVDMLVGSDGANVVGGLEAAYVLFRSEGDDVFRSSLKLKAGYLFEDANGIDSGVINAGLIGTVGY